jgi:hypothetical protein
MIGSLPGLHGGVLQKKPASAGSVPLTIAEVAGKNPVFSPDGREPAMNILVRLLCSLPVAACAICAGADRSFADTRVARVIGNDADAHAPHLLNPSHDAEEVGAALGREGFRTIAGLVLDQAGDAANRRPAAPSNRCEDISGSWHWFNGGTVVINANGTTEPNGGISANWSCVDGTYVFKWSHGYTDRFSLSATGNRLHGRNNTGMSVWGVRN